jgi:hypothetical protein
MFNSIFKYLSINNLNFISKIKNMIFLRDIFGFYYAVDVYLSHPLNFVSVCYHDDGSKKLNACILSLSHMIYL